jgi:fatty-acyl-CoA synthase
MEVPLLVNDFLKRSAALYPDKVAIIDGERSFTYKEFQDRANRLSHALLSSGIRKGDRVCVLSPNSHFFLESFYGVSQIGAVLVPLNYRLVSADHEYIIDHAGVKAILVDYDHVDAIEAIRSSLKTVETWVIAQEEREAREGWIAWESWIEKMPVEPPADPGLSETDLVSINYTSGTTARPKGVMMSHRNCYVNAYNFIVHLKLSHDDVELWTLPMFHCNGWGGVYALTGLGATHVVLRAVVGKRIFELIAAHRVTFACMAPTVLNAILQYPDRDQHQIETRPRFVVAGAPPPAAFIERLEKELGWGFIQIYGLTETSPILTVTPVDAHTAQEDYQRRSRAGIPVLGVTLQLFDDKDDSVPQDDVTIGEVCARSNVIFGGYWKQPEATAEATRDGWFRSGDLATWDSTGSINIVDRKKDVIISGGENISSPEIEAILYQHPSVLECAVIGVPHSQWGETPKALVVLREEGQVTSEEMIGYCRENLAHFKCPTSVDFLENLPRTATGKLQKFRLREKYWQGQDKRVN